MNFSYDEFVTRNLGFVDEKEQLILKGTRIFCPGAGGMGGTALACLARAGVEHFIISDPDTFEVSNLNRQIFSSLDRIGKNKAESARESLKQINPGIEVEIYGLEWTQKLDEILSRVDVVLNGCDDTLSTVILMRKAKQHGKTVVDAFASTLPSVYVVSPDAPRPEETFQFPTLGLEPAKFTPEIAKAAAGCEMEYVLVHSSTIRHAIFSYGLEMVTGKRKRISFAPMVWMTGILMSYEIIKFRLKKEHLCDHRGVFLNPWTFCYEHPVNPLWAFIKRKLVRRYLASLSN
jgi:molybdopterin/thiamine biosynthesis adenylyltransferase